LSYRNDASALLARVNALERELKVARREIAALRREAGHPVDEAWGDLGDVEVREDDLHLARQILEGLLDEQPRVALGPVSPPKAATEPEVVRDAATNELVVLRRALLALLGRRLGAVPPALVARIDACVTSTQLIAWIAEVGSVRGRRSITRAFDEP